MSVESLWMPDALPFFSLWKVLMMSSGVMEMLLAPACWERVFR